MKKLNIRIAKTIRLSLGILFFMTINCLMSSCLNDNRTTSPKVNFAEVNNHISKEKWGVTFYNQSGSLHTSDFSGYSLTFKNDGTLVATSASDTKMGIWNAMEDNDSTKITIDFAAETYGSFVSISDDWIVVTNTNSKIKLKHISDDASIDLLTFEKIQ